jgi:hypothetical protein
LSFTCSRWRSPFSGSRSRPQSSARTWLALFLSGVIGILRGELIPLAYQIESNIASNSRRQSEILEAFQRGIQIQITFVEDGAERSLTGERAAEKLGQVVSTLEERWSTANTKIGRRYVAMKIAFMVGIGCLLVARGMPPALSVAERLASWWALAPP